LLEKEKSSLKEQLLQAEDNLKKIDGRLNDQLTALTKSKQEAEVKLGSEVNLLNQKQKEAEDRIKALKNEELSLRAGFEKQIDFLNTKISALNDKNSNLQKELQSKIKALDSSIRASEEAKLGAENRVMNEAKFKIEKEIKLKELEAKIAALGKKAPAYREQPDFLDMARAEAESKVTSLIKTNEDLVTECNKQLTILKNEKRDTEIRLKNKLLSLEKDRAQTEKQLKNRITELEKDSGVKRTNVEMPKNLSTLIEENHIPE